MYRSDSYIYSSYYNENKAENCLRARTLGYDIDSSDNQLFDDERIQDQKVKKKVLFFRTDIVIQVSIV